MKVTAFIGSPRKNGNVDTLATEILNGAKMLELKLIKYI